VSTRTELWVPGNDLSEEYPTPPLDELAQHWSEYTGKNTLSTNGVYGAFTEPTQPIRAIASIDVCEVLRDSVGSIDLASGRKITRRSNYAEGLWFKNDETLYDSVYQQSFYTNFLRVAMTNGQVPPVENIEEINDIVSGWQERGIYPVANTATLEGCEIGTIRHTLGKYMAKSFAAIVFPRYFESEGMITKPTALKALATDLNVDLKETPTIHIDDAVKHIKAFDEDRDSFTDLDLIIPLHTDNGDEAFDRYHVPTPLAAFERADKLFAERGI